MIVYRITRSLHQQMDGEGARRSGGRWNSPGVPVVYASATRALAALEYLTHIDIDQVPDDLVLMSVAIPDVEAIEDLAGFSVGSESGGVGERAMGDRWVQSGTSAVLSVPSRLIPEERNYVLNSKHHESAQFVVVATRRFVFDARLV